MLATVLISNNSSVITDNQFYYSLHVYSHTKKYCLSIVSDVVQCITEHFLSPNGLGKYQLVEINDRELEIIMSCCFQKTEYRRHPLTQFSSLVNESFLSPGGCQSRNGQKYPAIYQLNTTFLLRVLCTVRLLGIPLDISQIFS